MHAEEAFDFSLSEEALFEHHFQIYSLQGCDDCKKLVQAIHDAYQLISAEKDVPVYVEKFDVTAEVKANKTAFVAKLIREHGYAVREDGRVLFPICVYNGRFIGHYRECYGKFCSIMDDYL